jgi:hypothetical protein
MWLPHFTSGHGLYRESKIVMIPSNWLEDIVEGEQNNLDFFCKFTRTKNHIRLFAASMLSHPRANSITFVYRCGLWNAQFIHFIPMSTFYGCSMYWGMQCFHFYLVFFLNITIWWILWQFHNLKNIHGNFHSITVIMFVGFPITSD